MMLARRLAGALLLFLLLQPVLLVQSIQSPVSIAAASDPSESDCLAPGPATLGSNPRFDLVSSCATARGVVALVMDEAEEGDVWITLRPDPDTRSLLTPVEAARPHPLLWVKLAEGGPSAVGRPVVGDHVAVTGALVWDNVWGWRELRPVWRLWWLDPDAPTAPARPISATASGLVLNDVATYTVVVNNLGDQPLADVDLDASIPDGATFDSLVATPTDATWQGASSDGVHWTVASIPPGASEGPFVYRVDLGNGAVRPPLVSVRWDGASAVLQIRGSNPIVLGG